MRIQNYSEITSLLRKKGSKDRVDAYLPNKEGEPKFKEKPVLIETPKKEAERPREQSTSVSGPPPQLEILPDLPTVDEELRKEGVELVDSDTIFVGTRKIDLPIPLEKVESGLHKPLNSGWRWVAELTKYILARFHIVIKRVGKQFKLVEQN